MEYQAAIEEVRALRTDLERESWFGPLSRAMPASRATYKAAREGIDEHLPVVLEIAVVARLQNPERLSNWNGEVGACQHAIAACDQLVGLLKAQVRRREVMAPDPPGLAAAQLHPWVYDVAVDQWVAGHRRDALQRAATNVFDRELRAKVGRHDMQAPDLVGHVFDVKDPAPSDVRLRIPGYIKGTPEWRDVHAGTRDFGKGCAQAIRNLYTHGLDEPNEVVAFEALAALSFLARRIDDASVERHPSRLADNAAPASSDIPGMTCA